jgi:uncharacterized membrane protein YkvA (DUF1232 family)
LVSTVAAPDPGVAFELRNAAFADSEVEGRVADAGTGGGTVEMKKIALLLKVVKNDLRVLWYALRHPDRPVWLMPAFALVALYAIDPFNFAVPFVGIVDDGVLVPMALHLMVRFLPTELQRLRRR